MLGPAMAVHVNFLSRFALLAGLEEELKLRLAARMQRQTLPRRAVAIEKGKAKQGMRFVLDGRLQGVDFTADGREAGLYFVAAGDYCGELAVVDGGAAPEHVIAVAKSEVLWLADEDARELLLTHSLAAAGLARRLAARLREAHALRSVLALPNPLARLAAQLLALAQQHDEIRHAPTHQELAIMINTTRETVSRCFQTLVAQKALARDGERLIIKDAALLAALAQGKTVHAD